MLLVNMNFNLYQTIDLSSYEKVAVIDMGRVGMILSQFRIGFHTVKEFGDCFAMTPMRATGAMQSMFSDVKQNVSAFCRLHRCW